MTTISGSICSYSMVNMISCSPVTRCKVLKKWYPPELDLVKIIFDGVMFNEQDEAGIGVIICNSMGKVMAALSEKIKKPPTVEILELLSAKQVVWFSFKTGFNKSVIEGDSESVIRSLSCTCLSPKS
nr:hypothetical protein CFP56_20069 [Quercus suber]